MTHPDLLLGEPRVNNGQPDETDKAAGTAAVAALRAAMAQGPDAVAAALSEITGPFAVGLHDPERDCTVLAVDPVAMQTLCYAVRGGALHFAERADVLASDGAALDLQALYDYLYFHCIPSPRTVYQGVARLPAGHFAWFQGGQLTVRPYCRPRFETAPQGPSDFASLKSEFHTTLRHAVRRQLDGSRAACFLSGGTDSSTVAGILTEIAGRPAATFSIGFEAEGYDEMAYARIAAKHFGTEHHEYYVTPADLVRGIPLAAAYHDQPFGNSSALPAFCCASVARDHGVTRLLAGDGGDELFGGNTRYAKQRVFAWYDTVPGPLRRGLLEPLSDSALADKVPLVRKAASYVRQARVPMPDRVQTYNLLNRLNPDVMFTSGFLAAVDRQAPLEQQRAVWAESAGDGFVNRMLAYDWRYTLAENDLPKVRGSAEMAGVSVRYPLLDHAIVDFAARLPEDYKLKGLKLRWFFKEALRGFLPDAIITKQKHGFGLPFGVWANRDDGLKSLARDAVRGLGERGIVRREFVASLLDHHLPSHPGYYGEMVWILMMLEQWLRHHAPAYRLEA